jgi:uncharacterized protein YbjT (DUF2867 family)
MFAVMGVTGQVGGAVALGLLERGHAVRAIVRDELKAAAWKERGCELFVADVNNQSALAKALEGAEGVFVMLPPIFDPTEGFPEAKAAIATIYDALSSAKPGKVVALSTIGGHLSRPNLLTQLHMMETVLSELSLPLTILRPAWFIENTLWDIDPAKKTGVVPSFLQPLNQNFPMIAAQDIGREAAALLCENWQGHGVVQLEGPVRVSPNEIAATLAALVGRDVVMTAVPRDSWESTFRSQGMKNPVPRMQMLDGFNEGWIEFEGGISASKKTTTTLREALEMLIMKAS